MRGTSNNQGLRDTSLGRALSLAGLCISNLVASLVEFPVHRVPDVQQSGFWIRFQKGVFSELNMEPRGQKVTAGLTAV